MDQPLAEDDDEHNPGSVNKEKREVLRNDRQVRTTYFQHAQSDLDLELGGRFKKLIPSTVVGTGPSSIPQQPEGSPWRADPVPPEMPLGYSVEDHEPVGERHELIATSPEADASPAQADGGASADVGRPVFSRLKRRRI